MTGVFLTDDNHHNQVDVGCLSLTPWKTVLCPWICRAGTLEWFYTYIWFLGIIFGLWVQFLYIWCILMQLGKDFILREYTSRESQVSDLDVSFWFRCWYQNINSTSHSLSAILLILFITTAEYSKIHIFACIKFLRISQNLICIELQLF